MEVLMNVTSIVTGLVCVMVSLMAPFGYAEGPTVEVWNDGFLERDYPISMKKVNDVEFQMTHKWLSRGLTVLENGWMRLYGVGDEEGRFGAGKGGNVQMRFLKKGDDIVTVGIKWGDGDRKASEELHKKFQDILVRATSTPKE